MTRDGRSRAPLGYELIVEVSAVATDHADAAGCGAPSAGFPEGVFFRASAATGARVRLRNVQGLPGHRRFSLSLRHPQANRFRIPSSPTKSSA